MLDGELSPETGLPAPAAGMLGCTRSWARVSPPAAWAGASAVTPASWGRGSVLPRLRQGDKGHTGAYISVLKFPYLQKALHGPDPTE